MNKKELIDEVSGKVGITRKEVGNIIDAVTGTIKDALSEDKKVTLANFGSFRVLNRRAKRGRNPQTGEAINIPAKKVPRFKAGKKLREVVGQK